MAGPDHATWFRIDHESVIGAARRAAVRLARQIAFPESRAGEVAIAVSEVAATSTATPTRERCSSGLCASTAEQGSEWWPPTTVPG
jgi:hypothetical protein